MSDLLIPGLFESRHDFQETVRRAFAHVADVGCRELFISDTNFADWPLGESAVIQSLTRWAFAHRKLTVLAQSFDDFHQRHPRWVMWRRQWAHVVECRAFADGEPGDVPSALLAPGVVSVRLIEPLRYRGSVSFEAADALRVREGLDDVLQRSEEAFPASTLGL